MVMDDYLDPITNELINDVIILPSSKKDGFRCNKEAFIIS